MSTASIAAKFCLGDLMARYDIKTREVSTKVGVTDATVRNWRRKSTPPLRNFSRDLQLQLAQALTSAARDHGHDVTITADEVVQYTETEEAASPEADTQKQQQLFKPAWMSHDDWVEFKRRYLRDDGTFRCELTAKQWSASGLDFVWQMLPEANTFDHIIPKALGGGDDVDNLQPALKSPNSSRQDGADPWYQERSDFYDAPFTPEQIAALRVSQLECGVNAVESLADLFVMPRTNVTGNMFLANMCVRSGKLLTGAVVLPRAINQVITDRYGPTAVRIKTVLLLTKEEALRDQFVAEASREPLAYGIHSLNPRVLALDGNANTRKTRIEPALIRRDYDLVIGCLQSFYTENGCPKEGIAEMLRAYDLIAVDEPQFAEGQWKGLLRHTSHALVIGLTGTPLQPQAKITRERITDENGEERVQESFEVSCLKGDSRGGVYLLSAWTANLSDFHDHNLKHIPHSQAERDALVQVVGGDGYDTTVLSRGSEAVLHNRGNVYDRVNYAAVVAIQALKGPGGLWTRDRFWRNRHTASGPLGPMTAVRQSQQRDGKGYSPELCYPPHLIVVCRGIYCCERVAKLIQEEIDKNPDMLPEEGWRVETCHSGNLTSSRNRNRREAIFAGVDLADAEAVSQAEAKLREEGIYGPKPLTIPANVAEEPDKVHPFMRSWLVHKGQAIDAQCARVLVCDGMIKEGLNNPLILGVAQGARVSLAIVELIQRMARTLAAFIDTKEMKCCPAELDEPFFRSHAVFDMPYVPGEEEEAEADDGTIDRTTASIMRLALNYLRNAENYTEEIPHARLLLEGITAGNPAGTTPAVETLSHQHRVEVVRAIGQVRQETGAPDNAPIDPAPVLDRVRERFEDQPTPVMEKALELAAELASKPKKARESQRVWQNPNVIGPPILAEETRTALPGRDRKDALIAHAYTHMVGQVEELRSVGLELSDLIKEEDRVTTALVLGDLNDYDHRHRQFKRARASRYSLSDVVDGIVTDARLAIGLTFDLDDTLKSVVVEVKKAQKYTKTGKLSKAKDREITALNQLHMLARATIKHMMGCSGGKDADGTVDTVWRNGGVYDCPGVHDLLHTHRGTIVQAIERVWIESLQVDIQPLAELRKGLGLRVAGAYAPPNPSSSAGA